MRTRSETPSTRCRHLPGVQHCRRTFRRGSGLRCLIIWGRETSRETYPTVPRSTMNVARSQSAHAPAARSRGGTAAETRRKLGAHGRIPARPAAIGLDRRRSLRIGTRAPAAAMPPTHANEPRNWSRFRLTGHEQPIATVAPCWLFPKASVSRRKPRRRFGRIAGTTADPESPKCGNGDLQHLCELTFAQPKLSAVVGRIRDRLAHPRY